MPVLGFLPTAVRPIIPRVRGSIEITVQRHCGKLLPIIGYRNGSPDFIPRDRIIFPLCIEGDGGFVVGGFVLPWYYCSSRTLCPFLELLCRRGTEGGGSGRKVCYGNSKGKTCKAGLSSFCSCMVLFGAYAVGFTPPHGIEGKAFLELDSIICLMLRCGGCLSCGPTDEVPAPTSKVARFISFVINRN